jgi:hypothetical protein
VLFEHTALTPAAISLSLRIKGARFCPKKRQKSHLPPRQIIKTQLHFIYTRFSNARQEKNSLISNKLVIMQVLYGTVGNTCPRGPSVQRPPQPTTTPKTARIGKKAPTPKTWPKIAIYRYIQVAPPACLLPPVLISPRSNASRIPKKPASTHTGPIT